MNYRLSIFALVVMLPEMTVSAESLIAKKDGLYVLENAVLRPRSRPLSCSA